MLCLNKNVPGMEIFPLDPIIMTKTQASTEHHDEGRQKTVSDEVFLFNNHR